METHRDSAHETELTHGETTAIETNTNKRPYASPRFTAYGDLAELTQGSGNVDSDSLTGSVLG